MLTIFSRALLVADISQEELARTKGKLKNAGVAFEVKSRKVNTGDKSLRTKPAELFAVYVRKCDYTQAKKTMERG
ncbi:MAG: hypothetical protein PHT58_07560 [Eubacteriales bacterium]|nr:hypothetical protein [Eubacteriales bacterium]